MWAEIFNLISFILFAIISILDRKDSKKIEVFNQEENVMSKDTVYTDEVTAAMVEAYVACEDQEARDRVVKDLAKNLGTSEPSVRAKLVREKVYISKNKEKSEKVVTKADYVGQIADEVGVEAELFDSLEKANKNVLERILFAFLDRDGEFETE